MLAVCVLIFATFHKLALILHLDILPTAGIAIFTLIGLAATARSITKSNLGALTAAAIGAGGLGLWVWAEEPTDFFAETTQSALTEPFAAQAVLPPPISLALLVEAAKPCDELAASLNLPNADASALRAACLNEVADAAPEMSPDESAGSLNALQLEALADPDAVAIDPAEEP